MNTYYVYGRNVIPDRTRGVAIDHAWTVEVMAPDEATAHYLGLLEKRNLLYLIPEVCQGEHPIREGECFGLMVDAVELQND